MGAAASEQYSQAGREIGLAMRNHHVNVTEQIYLEHSRE